MGLDYAGHFCTFLKRGSVDIFSRVASVTKDRVKSPLGLQPELDELKKRIQFLSKYIFPH